MATVRNYWQRQYNNGRSYWSNREWETRNQYLKEEDAMMSDVNRIYEDMYRWCETEIDRFYGRYADAEGIDITEAKARVSKVDIEEYERLAKEYVANKDFSPLANEQMRLYNATMRINRLEMLKARIGIHIVGGFNDLDGFYERVATDRATKEIQRQAGILGDTVSNADTVKTAKEIAKGSFKGATFSQRIWSHMATLKNDLANALQQGLIAGIGSSELARRVKKKFNTSRYNAERLIRTELRALQTDVAMNSYKRQGIDRYVFLAVNRKACPICRALNNKDFAVAEAQKGENAPPIHPNCHCTTAPYIDESEYNMWLEWLNQGGTTEQWNKMTPTQQRNWYRKHFK